MRAAQGLLCQRGSALRHGPDTRGWAAQTRAPGLGSLAAPAALRGGAEPISASFPEKPPSPWQPRASHGSPGSAACHPARRLAAPARCQPRDARDAGGAAVPWGARAVTVCLRHGSERPEMQPRVVVEGVRRERAAPLCQAVSEQGSFPRWGLARAPLRGICVCGEVPGLGGARFPASWCESSPPAIWLHQPLLPQSAAPARACFNPFF